MELDWVSKKLEKFGLKVIEFKKSENGKKK